MSDRRGGPTRGRDDAAPNGAKSGRLGRIDDRIIDALGQIDAGVPAEKALAALFKRARDLGGSERREVGDAVFGITRGRRRLQDKLHRGAKAAGRNLDLLDAPIRFRLMLLALLHEQGATNAELAARDPYAYKRVPRLFDKIAKLKPSKDLGVRLSLPGWMARKLIDAYGQARAEAVGLALSQRAPLTVRANTAATDRDAVRLRVRNEHGVECEPTPIAPHGLIVTGAADVESWPVYREGAIEIQDEGSQLLACAVGAQPGDNIIDACAGAGGKTLALAAAMNNGGRIVAIDRDKDRIAELKKRTRRAGLTNVEAITTDFIRLPDRFLGWADRVLVDAPCTGTGTFRRHPDAIWALDEAEAPRLAGWQVSLLRRAIDAVKPGGYVVYATCSVLHEENEAVVQRVLEEDPRVEPARLSETMGDLAEAIGATHCATVGPGPTDRDPDGFFVALLRRRVE